MARKIKFDVVLRLNPSDTGRVFQNLLLVETAEWTETLEIIVFLSYCPKHRISITEKAISQGKCGVFCFPLYIYLAYLTQQELLRNIPFQKAVLVGIHLHAILTDFLDFFTSGVECVNTSKQYWRAIKEIIKKKVFTQKFTLYSHCLVLVAYVCR